MRIYHIHSIEAGAADKVFTKHLANAYIAAGNNSDGFTPRQIRRTFRHQFSGMFAQLTEGLSGRDVRKISDTSIKALAERLVLGLDKDFTNSLIAKVTGNSYYVHGDEFRETGKFFNVSNANAEDILQKSVEILAEKAHNLPERFFKTMSEKHGLATDLILNARNDAAEAARSNTRLGKASKAIRAKAAPVIDAVNSRVGAVGDSVASISEMGPKKSLLDRWRDSRAAKEVAEDTAEATTETGRKTYQFFTHNKEAKFSLGRTAAFGIPTAVVLVGVGALSNRNRPQGMFAGQPMPQIDAAGIQQQMMQEAMMTADIPR